MIETRRLAGTDLDVSRACVGTMTFGSDTDAPMAARIVEASLDRGVNFFDTANVYNFGQAEFILGNLLKDRRQGVVIASKVGMKTGADPEAAGLSAGALVRNCDETLRRLQTEYLDIYYLHRPDYSVPVQETLEAMDRLVRAGKVRYAGVSNYAAWQLCELLWVCDKMNYAAPLISQPPYNLLARAVEQEYLPFCQAFGVSTVVYNPLARGLLTGTRTRTATAEGAGAADRSAIDRYEHPAYFDAVDELRNFAELEGRSLVDFSFNWLLHHTAADCVVMGAVSVEQVTQNLDVFSNGPLSSSSIAECEAVWERLRGVTPRYSR